MKSTVFRYVTPCTFIATYVSKEPTASIFFDTTLLCLKTNLQYYDYTISTSQNIYI